MRWILICAALLPAPAAALEICDDLWFTRNLMFHRAGHCFGSVLGKAVFGNEGCKPGGAELDDAAAALVVQVRAREAEWDCVAQPVDTGQDFLAVPVIAQRKALVDVPLASGYESGCIGWKGAPLALRNARDDGAEVTATVRADDTLLFQFDDVGDWSFVEIQQDGIPAGLGWAKVMLDDKVCEMLAG